MGKSVLIVDNSFGSRLALREHLVSFGYHVVGEARSIQESIEKYRHLKPDLVLMDAGIPDADGVAGVTRLLQEDGEANVLFCVSRGQRALAVEAIWAGARDFITKPVNPRRLCRIIQALID